MCMECSSGVGTSSVGEIKQRLLPNASPSFRQHRGVPIPLEHSLNIIECQKWAKTPYQTISFWETVRIPPILHTQKHSSCDPLEVVIVILKCHISAASHKNPERIMVCFSPTLCAQDKGHSMTSIANFQRENYWVVNKIKKLIWKLLLCYHATTKWIIT